MSNGYPHFPDPKWQANQQQGWGWFAPTRQLSSFGFPMIPTFCRCQFHQLIGQTHTQLFYNKEKHLLEKFWVWCFPFPKEWCFPWVCFVFEILLPIFYDTSFFSASFFVPIPQIFPGPKVCFQSLNQSTCVGVIKIILYTYLGGIKQCK